MTLLPARCALVVSRQLAFAAGPAMLGTS